jgi:hypothetical protein
MDNLAGRSHFISTERMPDPKPSIIVTEAEEAVVTNAEVEKALGKLRMDKKKHGPYQVDSMVTVGNFLHQRLVAPHLLTENFTSIADTNRAIKICLKDASSKKLDIRQRQNALSIFVQAVRAKAEISTAILALSAKIGSKRSPVEVEKNAPPQIMAIGVTVNNTTAATAEPARQPDIPVSSDRQD